MSTIINILVQLVAGIVGGNLAGSGIRHNNLGAIVNSAYGAIGGLLGGQVAQALTGKASAAGGTLDAAAMVSQLVCAGTGGAIMTAIVVYLMKALSGLATK